MKLEFSQKIFKKKKILKISNFMKIHPVIAVLFNADNWIDRWTVMMKLKVAFHNFANMPNNRE